MAIFKTKQEAEDKLKSMAQLGKMLEVREVKDGWGLKRKNLIEPEKQGPTPPPVVEKIVTAAPIMSCSSPRPMSKSEKIREGKKICEASWWV